MGILSLCWQYRKFVGAMLWIIALYLAYMLWHMHVFELGQLKERSVWQIRWNERDALDQKTVAAELEQRRIKQEQDDAHNAEVTRTYQAQLLAIAGDRDSLARRLWEYKARFAALSGAVPETQVQPGTADATPQSSGTGTADADFDSYDRACRADAAQLAALIEEINGS